MLIFNSLKFILIPARARPDSHARHFIPNHLIFLTLQFFLGTMALMRCPNCGFTDFKIQKKCTSCNAILRKSSSAEEPALVIFGTAGMVADNAGEMGLDSAGLDDSLDAPPTDDFGSGEPEDFALDLSDAKSDQDEPAQAVAMAPPEDTGMDFEPAVEDSIVPEEPAEAEVDMQFDIGDTEMEVHDAEVDVDDMGFDFEADTAEIDGDADLFEGSMDELSLDDSTAAEVSSDDSVDGISLDDSAAEDLTPGPDFEAEPATDLDTDTGVDLDPAISLDDEPETSLEMDLDLDTEEPTPTN